MKNCIIGYTGFVGSNIISSKRFDEYYNSKNIKNIENKIFDEIYFCGLPGLVWFANKYPEKDTNNLNKLINILNNVKCNKFILISTINIYNDFNKKYNEDYIPNINLIKETYGKNRLIFEKFLMDNFNYYIIRLPAIYGYNMKKNIIYDLINKNYLENIILEDVYQFYYLNDITDNIQDAINKNIKIKNLFPQPISVRELIKNCFSNYKIVNNNIKIDDNIINLKNEREPKKYDIQTKHDKSKYLYSKKYVFDKIKEFINNNEIYQKNISEHLIISNIAWKDTYDDNILSLLKKYGIKYLEIAPTKISMWNELDKNKIELFCQHIKKYDLEIYSMQSITYQKNNLQIFSNNNSRNEFIKHIKHLIDLFHDFGLKIIIFGCPLNRNYDNNYDEIIAKNFFKEIGDYAYEYGITIVIETLTKYYKCNYLNKMKEAYKLIKDINSPGIKLHLDIGNLYMEIENLDEIINYKDCIDHVQISMFNLENFDNLPINYNIEFHNKLKQIGYSKKISIEMKSTNNDIINIENAIKIISNIYYK